MMYNIIELARANSIFLVFSQLALIDNYTEGEIMMPLNLADVGEVNIIKKIGGKAEVKAHLENLGFIVGGAVTVLNTIGGNIIVNVKESRIAISKEMAQKIMV